MRTIAFKVVGLLVCLALLGYGVSLVGKGKSAASAKPRAPATAVSTHEPTVPPPLSTTPVGSEPLWPDTSRAHPQVPQLAPSERDAINMVIAKFEAAYFSVAPTQSVESFSARLAPQVIDTVLAVATDERAGNLVQLRTADPTYAFVACAKDITYPNDDMDNITVTVVVTRTKAAGHSFALRAVCLPQSAAFDRLSHRLTLLRTDLGWRVSSLPEFTGGVP